jgi:arabinoxylan arabinofuranohydrolase
VEAATICYEKGVKTKPRGRDAQGVCVNVTENGAYIELKGVDFGDKGAANFHANLATETDGASIALRLDSETGESIGTLKVKSTGALDNWETQSCKIKGARGRHDLYLKFFGKGAPVMNIDWWKFE